MKRTTVLLADDHVVVREGLRVLIEMQRDLEVVGEAADGREAVELARSLEPDVAILDIAMPRLNGMEATRQLLRFVPGCRVLILSAYGDEAYVTRALGFGAAGYLVKQSAGEVLVRAVRKVRAGGVFFSPQIARRLDRAAPDEWDGGTRGARTAGRPLTSREAEVLQSIAEGMANKQMAALLGISIKTVEKHRQSLMRKLDVHDTAGLTRYAIANGIIETPVRTTIR